MLSDTKYSLIFCSILIAVFDKKTDTIPIRAAGATSSCRRRVCVCVCLSRVSGCAKARVCVCEYCVSCEVYRAQSLVAYVQAIYKSDVCVNVNIIHTHNRFADDGFSG